VGDQRGFRELSTWLFCHTIVQLPSSFSLRYGMHADKWHTVRVCGGWDAVLALLNPLPKLLMWTGRLFQFSTQHAAVR
jgi:hypothetical protein